MAIRGVLSAVCVGMGDWSLSPGSFGSAWWRGAHLFRDAWWMLESGGGEQSRVFGGVRRQTPPGVMWCLAPRRAAYKEALQLWDGGLVKGW